MSTFTKKEKKKKGNFNNKKLEKREKFKREFSHWTIVRWPLCPGKIAGKPTW